MDKDKQTQLSQEETAQEETATEQKESAGDTEQPLNETSAQTEPPKAKKKSKWKLIYILGTMIVILFIVFLDPNSGDIFSVANQLNPWWIVGAFGAVLLYWITDALILGQMTGCVAKPMGPLRTLKIGIIGLYYGALTPFATGGQPIQVYYMKRDAGIPVGIATCVVTLKFLMYELGICSIYIIAMVFNGEYFYNEQNEVFWISSLGFAVNLFGLGFLLLSLFHKRFVLKFVRIIYKVLSKIKIIRHPEKHLHSVEKTVEEFSASAKYLGKNIFKMVISYVLSVINLGLLFSITYFIYRAVGLDEVLAIEIMAMQSFLYLAVMFFPTPGAAGGSEGGFGLFFGSYFAPISWQLPMIIWRFLTYYLMLLVGALIVILDEFFAGRRKKTQQKDDE